MQAYLDAVRNNVCPVCLDAVMAGNQFVRCGLPAGRKCPVEIYLPQVVEVVESVDSWLMDDYVEALREKVCAFCENSTGDFCALRLQADCALDRYFMLVADAIKEVDTRTNAVNETAGIP
ncbi:hypothetical protein L0337_03635 [candidate division KSB1 bacterium]|nr:hypothetical protein [candidate division KSB1 bacterium]